MITSPAHQVQTNSTASRRFLRQFPQALLATLGLALLVVLPGCETAPMARGPVEAKAPEVLTIREGDVLKIVFPDTPSLDTQQQVRRDGRITLGVIGEMLVIGKTPTELEQVILKGYGTQITAKEVSVTVISSSFSVFVTGAVIKPGKVQADRALSALEAVMEAGGFDRARADMKNVVVTRQVDGQTTNTKLNMKDILEGKSTEVFYLKQSDIIYVPEKFSWF